MTPAAGWLVAFRPASGQAPGELALLEAPAGSSISVSRLPPCHVVFDGTLHDRSDLLARLGADPAREPSDAELVGLAYRSWGEAAISRLKGVFAVIIEDRDRGLLLCARDPLGIVPLFYAETGGAILLSPSVRALLDRPGVSRDINRASMVDRLSRMWPALDETYFTRVRRVPPGHVARFGRGDRRVERYWHPIPPEGPIAWIPDGEAQERFEVELGRAVARCVGPGQAGIYTSGGLDSSMLAMVTADLCTARGWPPPRSLSLLFTGTGRDEQTVQRGVAAELGLPQLQLPFEEAAGPEGTLAAALSMTRMLPAPLTVIWRPALERLAIHAREHGGRVILAGDGADEWLWENPIMAADLIASLDAAGLYRLWRIYARSYQFSRREAFRLVAWRYGARHLLVSGYHRAAGRIGGRHVARHRWLSGARQGSALLPWVAPDRELRAQIAERLDAAIVRREIEGTRESHYARDTRSRLDAPDKWFREEETFAVGQRTGIAVREPFWDPDLIELLVRVRPEARSAGGLAKALVRRPLARRFPGLGFEGQRKSNLGVAFLSVLAAQAEGVRRAMGGFPALADLGVIDPKQVDVLLDDAFAGRTHRDRIGWAWELLNLEAWARANS